MFLLSPLITSGYPRLDASAPGASKTDRTGVWFSEGVVTDDELIRQVAQGHEGAAEALYRRYAPPVFTLALQMLNSREEAEEVLQDTFLKLYRKAPDYEAERASVKTFIYAIARSQALSHLRSRRRTPATSPYDAATVTEMFAAPEQPDPLTGMMVRDALAQLSVQERTLLEASFYEGVSHEQLATRHGLPLGTLKSKLRRALLKLHTLLGDV